MHITLYLNLPCSMTVTWGGTTAGNLRWILLLQKRAMRILNRLQYDESCREKCCAFSIMTVIAFCIWEIALHHTAEKIYKEAQMSWYQTLIQMPPASAPQSGLGRNLQTSGIRFTTYYLKKWGSREGKTTEDCAEQQADNSPF